MAFIGNVYEPELGDKQKLLCLRCVLDQAEPPKLAVTIYSGEAICMSHLQQVRQGYIIGP